MFQKYCGFFQSKISSHLTDTDNLFKLIGYYEVENNILSRQKVVEPIFLYEVGFECMVASVECSIIHDAHTAIMDPRLTLSHVVKLRGSNSGDIEQLIIQLRKDIYYSQDPSKKPSKHLSLKTVDNVTDGNNAPTKLSARSGGSNLYTDNPPKVKELENEGQGHIKRDTDSNPSNSTIEGLPYADESLEKINEKQHDKNEGQGHDKTPDYEEGTMDDHILASLKLVSEEKRPEKIELPFEGSGKPSEQWDYVRQGLKKQYGDGYYEGLRGNILKPTTPINPLFPPGRHKNNETFDPYLQTTTVKNNETFDPYFQTNTGTNPSAVGLTDSGIGESEQRSSQQIYYPPTMQSDPYTVSGYSTNPSNIYSQHVQKQQSSFPGNKPSNIYSQPVQQQQASFPGSSGRAMQPRDYPSVDRRSVTMTKSCPPNTASINTAIPNAAWDTRDIVNAASAPPVPCRGANTQNLQKSSSLTRKALPRLVDYDEQPRSSTEPIATRPRVVNVSNAVDQLDTVKSIHHSLDWVCRFCTVSNLSQVTICQVCGKSKSVNVTSNLNTSKVCASCTYENLPSAKECDMCQSNLLSSKQSVV